MLVITTVLVLASCATGKNCHCKCDAYSESILNPENKEFVDMQGAKIATWSQSAWDHETQIRAMYFDTF